MAGLSVVAQRKRGGWKVGNLFSKGAEDEHLGSYWLRRISGPQAARKTGKCSSMLTSCLATLLKSQEESSSQSKRKGGPREMTQWVWALCHASLRTCVWTGGNPVLWWVRTGWSGGLLAAKVQWETLSREQRKEWQSSSPLTSACTLGCEYTPCTLTNTHTMEKEQTDRLDCL